MSRLIDNRYYYATIVSLPTKNALVRQDEKLIQIDYEETRKTCNSRKRSLQSGKNIFNLVGQKTQLMVEYMRRYLLPLKNN